MKCLIKSINVKKIRLIAFLSDIVYLNKKKSLKIKQFSSSTIDLQIRFFLITLFYLTFAFMYRKLLNIL